MVDNGTITLVMVCDDHYMVLLAALLKSVEVNHKTGEEIVAYIVEDRVSNKSKQKLEQSLTSGLISLVWIKMQDVIPEGTQLPLDKSSYPLNIYMRLFIPSFLPNDVKRVLYLDVDMIAMADVSELYHSEMAENVIAAVTDPIGTLGNKWGGIANYEALNLPGEAKYFNTGLLLMDLESWRREKVTEKVLLCVQNNREFANFPDQYGLNIVLYGKWKELDPVWNCFSSLDLQEPKIIHFNHRKPIYASYDKNPEYQKWFFSYLNQTVWKGTKPIGEGRRYLKKIKNILEKIVKIPFSKK